MKYYNYDPFCLGLYMINSMTQSAKDKQILTYKGQIKMWESLLKEWSYIDRKGKENIFYFIFLFGKIK